VETEGPKRGDPHQGGPEKLRGRRGDRKGYRVEKTFPLSKHGQVKGENEHDLREIYAVAGLVESTKWGVERKKRV